MNAIRTFLADCNEETFPIWFYGLRAFSCFADLTVRRLAPPERIAEIALYAKRKDDGELLTMLLLEDDEFPITDEQLELVLCRSIEGQDNAEVDRVMNGIRALAENLDSDIEFYLEASGWGKDYLGYWYNPESGETLDAAEAVLAQGKVDAHLFEAHRLMMEYTQYKADRQKIGQQRDYDALHEKLDGMSKREEREVNIHVVFKPGQMIESKEIEALEALGIKV